MSSDAIVLPPAPASSTPAGLIAAFAGGTPPVGWWACDGSEIVVNAVSQGLYAAIGVSWGGDPGAPVNSRTFFLPDLRGYFLRGLDAGGGINSPIPGAVDTQVQGRLSSRPDLSNGLQGDAGDKVGSSQGAGMPGNWQNNLFGGGSSGAILNSGGGSPEVRPVNKAVLYIIKY